MNPPDWKDIWNYRPAPSALDLESATRLAGFDVGLGAETPEGFMHYVGKVLQYIRVCNSDQIIEFGCGSGVFLHCLQSLTGCSVTGIDYSAQLTDFAREFVDGEYRFSVFVHK